MCVGDRTYLGHAVVAVLKKFGVRLHQLASVRQLRQAGSYFAWQTIAKLDLRLDCITSCTSACINAREDVSVLYSKNS